VPARDVSVLNAARRSSSPDGPASGGGEGSEAIDSGAAQNVLERLVARTRELSDAG
jgi:hypothetical protein